MPAAHVERTGASRRLPGGSGSLVPVQQWQHGSVAAQHRRLPGGSGSLIPVQQWQHGSVAAQHRRLPVSPQVVDVDGMPWHVRDVRRRETVLWWSGGGAAPQDDLWWSGGGMAVPAHLKYWWYPNSEALYILCPVTEYHETVEIREIWKGFCRVWKNTISLRIDKPVCWSIFYHIIIMIIFLQNSQTCIRFNFLNPFNLIPSKKWIDSIPNSTHN